MRLLLINPNRTAAITERVAQPARRMLAVEDVLDTVTSTTGPEVVRSPAQLEAASQEVQSLAARHGSGYDAIILGISLDCGLMETRRQQRGQWVIGMTEAACHAACIASARFGVLTVGSGMAGAYAEHVRALGLESRCIGVAAPDCPEAFVSPATAQVPEVLRVLTHSAFELRSRGADSIVLAGAVLCGYGAALAQVVSIPVWEGPACAVSMARLLIENTRSSLPALA